MLAKFRLLRSKLRRTVPESSATIQRTRELMAFLHRQPPLGL